MFCWPVEALRLLLRLLRGEYHAWLDLTHEWLFDNYIITWFVAWRDRTPGWLEPLCFAFLYSFGVIVGWLDRHLGWREVNYVLRLFFALFKWLVVLMFCCCCCWLAETCRCWPKWMCASPWNYWPTRNDKLFIGGGGAHCPRRWSNTFSSVRKKTPNAPHTVTYVYYLKALYTELATVSFLFEPCNWAISCLIRAQADQWNR